MNTSHHYRGFTLNELLVVIVIISILAAVLFPVFATARERDQQSVCSTNLGQLGVAIAQYVQDHDQTYPCGQDAKAPAGTPGLGWGGQVMPYVKSNGYFTCPSDTTPPYDAYNSNIASYALNCNTVITQTGNTGALQPQKTTSFLSPAVTVELFEVSGFVIHFPLPVPDTESPTGNGANGQTNNSMTSNAGKCWPFYLAYLAGQPISNTAPTGPMNAPARHANGANYLMADGHVKYLMPEAVSVGFPPNTLTWNTEAASVKSLGAFAATFSIN